MFFFNEAIYLNVHYLIFNLKSVLLLPCNAAAFINTKFKKCIFYVFFIFFFCYLGLMLPFFII